MQIRPTAFTIGLIIHFSIALFCVYTEFGIDSIIRTPKVLVFFNQILRRQWSIIALAGVSADRSYFTIYIEHPVLVSPITIPF